MDEDIRNLLARAERTFGDQSVSDVVGKTKAIIGIMNLPAGEADAAEALSQLRCGRTPSARALAALEFMIRLMRPAPLSKGGDLDDLPTQNQYNTGLVAAWQGFRNLVKHHLYAVGRLEQVNGKSVGTGFLVADDLVVTNRHVLDALSFGSGRLGEGQATIRFRQEAGSRDSEGPTPVLASVAFHSTLDIALLRLPRQSNRNAFILETTPVPVGEPVATLGYPFQDGERNPIFVDPIYQGQYGVKRAAPGEVIQSDPPLIYHDCSTLGGNSGSPLLALKSAKVVGLHRSGLFMYRNEAVDAHSVASFVQQHQN